MTRTKLIKLAKSAAKYDEDTGKYDSIRFDDPQLQRIYDRKVLRIRQEKALIEALARKENRQPVPHATVRREIISRYGSLTHPAALAELRRAARSYQPPQTREAA